MDELPCWTQYFEANNLPRIGAEVGQSWGTSVHIGTTRNTPPDSFARTSGSAGVKHLIPIRLTRYLNLSADNAMYSVSANDIAVQSCFFDNQLTNLSPRNCIPPEVLLQYQCIRQSAIASLMFFGSAVLTRVIFRPSLFGNLWLIEELLMGEEDLLTLEVPVVKNSSYKGPNRRSNSCCDGTCASAEEETVLEGRYKDLFRACPHQGFTKLHQLDTFYNALNPADQDSLNVAAGGNLLERSTQDVLTVIENKSKPSGNLNFSPHPELTSPEVNNDIFDSEGCNVLSEKLLDLDSTKDLHRPRHDNPLSGSTTYFSNPLLEEFADELPLEYDDNLQFDIESDLKEIEFLLYQDKDSSLKDSIDQKNRANLADIFVDSIPEMFTDEHTLDYLSPPIFDVYDDDFLEVESDAGNVYPFDSKGEKIKESKLLIDELDLPCDFHPPPEYDSFISQDFSRISILLPKKPVEIITRVVQDKKLVISNASLVLEDFDPLFYEPLFFKEVPKSKMLLPFSSENEEKVFKPGIHTSEKVHSYFIPELSHQGYKVFKINQIFKSLMKIFLFYCGKDTHILAIPYHHFYPLDQFNIPGNVKTLAKGFCTQVFISSTSIRESPSLGERPGEAFTAPDSLRVISQDIMFVVQNNSVGETSNLQTELERTKERFENCMIKKENEYAKLWNDWYKKCEECKFDKISYDNAYNDMQQKIKRLQAQLGDLKGKNKDTSFVSDTLDPLSWKLKKENVDLQFHALNYAKENAHLKTTYKKLFDSIFVTRTQTKTIIDPLQNKLQDTIYENAKLRAQLFDKVSDQKDTTCGTSANTKINPFKPSREEKNVPNKVRASVRTNPITISQPHVITKKVVNFDSNDLSSTGVDNTKTRRPQPRSNTKNNRVHSASKSSCSKNKRVDVEEHPMNFLFSKNKKHMSSECNNVKLATQNVNSKVVCAM
nr:reverse transcriptase domain-containing protein [Tanacetum cinerariifolium]